MNGHVIYTYCGITGIIVDYCGLFWIFMGFTYNCWSYNRNIRM